LHQSLSALGHWQPAVYSLDPGGGPGALTRSSVGRGIIGTVASIVSTWQGILQLVSQVGEFPHVLLSVALVYDLGVRRFLAPLFMVLPLSKNLGEVECPLAGSHSQGHYGNLLLCLILARGPHQPFLAFFPSSSIGNKFN